MYGTDNRNGQYISGLDHLSQSVADILTTPLNSRVMVRGFGCALFDLVDTPMNAEVAPRVTEAVYMALNRWEPRLRLDRVDVSTDPGGVLAIILTGAITGTDIPYHQSVTLSREQLYRH